MADIGNCYLSMSVYVCAQVVVFDNRSNTDKDYTVAENSDDESSSAFLMRILQYLETPQYLRKALFPMHSSLRFVVGLIFLQMHFLKFDYVVDYLFSSCLILVVCIAFCRECCHPLMLHTICANTSGVRIGKVG